MSTDAQNKASAVAQILQFSLRCFFFFVKDKSSGGKRNDIQLQSNHLKGKYRDLFIHKASDTNQPCYFYAIIIATSHLLCPTSYALVHIKNLLLSDSPLCSPISSRRKNSALLCWQKRFRKKNQGWQ